VNSRQIAVQPGIAPEVTIPNITMKLVAIAISVMTTCKVVNADVDKPKIIPHSRISVVGRMLRLQQAVR
jgi:hypothetical protein